MQMARRIFCTMLACILIVSLAACGQSGGGGSF